MYRHPEHFNTFHPMQLKMATFMTTFIGAYCIVKGSFAVIGYDGYTLTDVATRQNYDYVTWAFYFKFATFLIIWAAGF